MKGPGFDVTITMNDGDHPTMTVVVSGEFDASRVQSFDHGLRADLITVGEIVIDLRGTTIIDSSALGALVRICERAEAASASYSTLVERPFQMKLMQVTGLSEVLHVQHVTA